MTDVVVRPVVHGGGQLDGQQHDGGDPAADRRPGHRPVDQHVAAVGREQLVGVAAAGRPGRLPACDRPVQLGRRGVMPGQHVRMIDGAADPGDRPLQPNTRFVILPVRHMSVRPGDRAGETADMHRQRPCYDVVKVYQLSPLAHRAPLRQVEQQEGQVSRTVFQFVVVSLQ